MNNSKHTPGPWVCKKYPKVFGIMAESGRQIAIMTEHHGDEPNTPMHQFERSPQDKADADLIAAAPELLKAAQDFLDSIQKPLKDLKGAFDNLQVAVNKAKGAK